MTLREIYQALLNGKKLCSPNLPFDKYVHLVGDELMYDDGTPANIILMLGKWSIYQEPEDLDPIMQAVSMRLSCKLGGSTLVDLDAFIDLKIKQAKLGK